jgi:circadian clock protein KaiB
MRAIRNLTRFVDQFLPGQTDVEIIDVCQQQCAMADNVFAVPALIRHRPAPSLVLLGDLSDAERLKRAFGADLDG